MDGFKLVPVEPTSGMLGAMRKVIEQHYNLANYSHMFKERHAYTAMLAAAPAAPVAAQAPSEWISVDERMPADETPVLVFRADQIQVGAVFLEHESWEEGGRTIRYWDDPHDDGKVWDDVNYWMPLPAAPDPYAGIAADFASPAMLTEQEPPCANT